MHRFLLSNLFEVVKETRRPIGNELLHIHSFFLLTNNSTLFGYSGFFLSFSSMMSPLFCFSFISSFNSSISTLRFAAFTEFIEFIVVNEGNEGSAGKVGKVGGDVKPGKLGIVEMEGNVGSAGRANGESSENAGIKSADSLFPRFPLFLVVRRIGVKPSEDGEKGKPGNPEIESRRKGEGKRETIDRSGETNMTKGEFGLEFDMEFDGNARLGEKMKFEFEFEFDRSIFGSRRSKNSTFFSFSKKSTFFSFSKNSTFFSFSNTQLVA